MEKTKAFHKNKKKRKFENYQII